MTTQNQSDSWRLGETGLSLGKHTWEGFDHPSDVHPHKAGTHEAKSTWANFFNRAANFSESLSAQKLRAKKTRRLMRLQSLVDHASLQQGVRKRQVKGPVAGVAKLKLRRLLLEQQAELQALRDRRP